MTAIDILKQSVSFYGRLFNKIFWISVASALCPLLIVTSDAEQSSLVTILVIMVMSAFFSTYMMVTIHQYSQDQNDSLTDAFRLTLTKLLPIIGTSIIFAVGAAVISIPAVIVGSLLVSGVSNEQLQTLFVGLIVAIPVCFYFYRCFFSVYFTLVDNLTPFDALKASNQLVKNNAFIFRSLTLLGFVMFAYIGVIILIELMVAVAPMAQSGLKFAINVMVLPYFTIFIYRLFVVAKAEYQHAPKKSDSDLDADD